jgi:hypothetical protein
MVCEWCANGVRLFPSGPTLVVAPFLISLIALWNPPSWEGWENPRRSGGGGGDQRNGLSLSFHRPLSVVYCSIGHWNISCMFGMIWLLFIILHSEIKHLVTAFVVVYLSGSKFTDYREFVATRQSLVTPQFWKVCTYSIISDVNVKINSVIFWFLIDYWVWRCYRHFNIEFGYCFRSGS